MLREAQRLIVQLEDTTAALRRRVQISVRFRFVSNAQSTPYTIAFARWEAAGGDGPPPSASPAEMRASIYDQASSASELRAIPIVFSAAALELGDATLSGLRDGHVVFPFTTLRGFIERVAYAHATATALVSLKTADPNGSLVPVLELSALIHKALYATQREWTKLVNADFRQIKPRDVKYASKPNMANMSADNILDAIDILDNKVAGARLAYEILCEFLHPNVGDLWGATLGADEVVDDHGTRHLTRYLGTGPKTLEGLPHQRIVYSKLLDICADVVGSLDNVLREIEQYAEIATRLARRYAHNLVKGHYAEQFRDFDQCPCLSGKTVLACTGRRASTR